MHLPLRGIGSSAPHGAMARAPLWDSGECNPICEFLRVPMIFPTLDGAGWYTRCRIEKSSRIQVSEYIPGLQPRDRALVRATEKKIDKIEFFNEM